MNNVAAAKDFAKFVSKISAVGELPRRSRNNALTAIHEEMFRVGLPKTSTLWTILDDAFEALT